MIPLAIGLPGSGKTSGMAMLGYLLIGRSFQVSGLEEGKLDGLLTALSSGDYVVVDNVEAYFKGLEDLLARYATGGDYRRRMLFSDNDLFKIAPRAILALTAITARFRRPDVAARLLPFHFWRDPEAPVLGETEFVERIAERRPAIMHDLLTKLGEIVIKLKQITTTPRLKFRMSDFAQFGWIVHAKNKHGEWESPEWEALLKNLEASQLDFSSEDDGIIEILRGLIETPGAPLDNLRTAELYTSCKTIAKNKDIPFPFTVPSFGSKLAMLRGAIERSLNVCWTERVGHAGTKFITIKSLGQQAKAANQNPRNCLKF